MNNNSTSTQSSIFQDAQNWLSKIPDGEHKKLETVNGDAENCLFNLTATKQEQLIAAYMVAAKELGSDYFGSKNKKLGRGTLASDMTEVAAEGVSDHLYELKNCMKAPAHREPGVTSPHLFWVDSNTSIHHVAINAIPKSDSPEDIADALLESYRAFTKERPATIRDALNLCA